MNNINRKYSDNYNKNNKVIKVIKVIKVKLKRINVRGSHSTSTPGVSKLTFTTPVQVPILGKTHYQHKKFWIGVLIVERIEN